MRHVRACPGSMPSVATVSRHLLRKPLLWLRTALSVSVTATALWHAPAQLTKLFQLFF